MSEIERDGFSAREMYLMREAMNAGSYYESLEQWLDEPISDAGHYVAQHLAHDAERLYGSSIADIEAERKRFMASFEGKADLKWLDNAQQFASVITQNLWESWQIMAEQFNRQAARALDGEAVAAYRYRVIGDPQGWEYSADPLFGPESGPGPREEYQALTLDQLLSELNDTHPQPAQQGSVPEMVKAIADKLEKVEGESADGGYMWDARECAEFIREEADKLTTTPQPEVDGWIKCSERLPTEADGDFHGKVWAWAAWRDEAILMGANEIEVFAEVPAPSHAVTHWKPTGLKRPNPPRGDQ